MIGAVGTVLQQFGADGRGKVRVRSELWDAESHAPLHKGAAVRVVQRDGLKLIVEPAEHPPGKED